MFVAPHRYRFRRERRVDVRRVVPWEDALLAFAFWKSLRSSHQPTDEDVLAVTADGHSFAWFGGFSGLRQDGEILVKTISGPSDRPILREIMWREALSGADLTPHQIPLWRALAERLLPDDMRQAVFPRGIGPSAVASQFGIARQTAAKYL